ncbi:hypothetical protein [Streptomyces sp. SID8352]|nr:hypothetical protein [Streptomyces sp. SID8352]
MNWDRAAVLASLIISAIGAIATCICGWYAREAVKRRGRHRRR